VLGNPEVNHGIEQPPKSSKPNYTGNTKRYLFVHLLRNLQFFILWEKKLYMGKVYKCIACRVRFMFYKNTSMLYVGFYLMYRV
jgi:hypothetical protein